MDFSQIKLLVLDFDGVMTDNRVLVDENGTEAVFCSRADGLGIEMLKKKTTIEVIVLSKEQNKVVKARCDKLNIECIYGIDEKYSLFMEEMGKRNLSLSQVCFIGNDINDLECIKAAGIGVATNDAYPEVKEAADYITSKRGGEGVVREIVDKILSSLKGENERKMIHNLFI